MHCGTFICVEGGALCFTAGRIEHLTASVTFVLLNSLTVWITYAVCSWIYTCIISAAWHLWYMCLMIFSWLFTSTFFWCFH